MTQARTLPGMFAPTFIGSEYVSKKDQAIDILEQVDTYAKQGYKKVGIIYPATNEEVTKISAAYNTNPPRYKTGIKGKNQAAVIGEVEKLLDTNKYKHLRNTFRINPITVSASNNHVGAVQQPWLDRDLNNIKTFLAPPNNNVVLGWQNDDANDYAIDSSQLNAPSATKNTTQKQYIQHTLEELAETYPLKENEKPEEAPPRPVIGNVKRHLGGIGGGIIGTLVSAIPIVLIITGIIALPFSFGGTVILIGAGVGIFFGGALGAWIGHKIGFALDIRSAQTPPPSPPRVDASSTPSQVQRRLSAENPDYSLSRRDRSPENPPPSPPPEHQETGNPLPPEPSNKSFVKKQGFRA